MEQRNRTENPEIYSHKYTNYKEAKVFPINGVGATSKQMNLHPKFHILY